MHLSLLATAVIDRIERETEEEKYHEMSEWDWDRLIERNRESKVYIIFGLLIYHYQRNRERNRYIYHGERKRQRERECGLCIYHY